MNIAQYLLKIVKGILIGVANAIPGVSGGTMMVSMGIYDDIISSINNFRKQMKKSFFTLLPYLIGMAVGIVGLSFCIVFCLERFPWQTAFVFIGLIFGGIPSIFTRVTKTKLGVSNIVIFLLFFAGIILLQVVGHNEDVSLTLTVGNVVALFFVGIIASATMIIPGVSGSLVMLILGFYNPVILTIKSFIEALATRDWDNLLRCTGLLVPMGIGVIVGIVLISKLIEFLLRKFEGLTYSGILGLVVASPIVVIMCMTSRPVMGIGGISMTAVAFAAGFAITKLLGGED